MLLLYNLGFSLPKRIVSYVILPIPLILIGSFIDRKNRTRGERTDDKL